MTTVYLALFLILYSCGNPVSSNQNTRGSIHTFEIDCEWCGAHEAPDDLSWQTQIAPDDEPGNWIMVSGTVFKSDSITPAEGVIIYAYHTNANGNYPKKGDETGNAKHHGYLRGWMQTNAEGNYSFKTIQPAAYPNSEGPAHIHVTIKEKDKDEYWLDEYYFSNDPNYDRLRSNNKLPKPEENNFSNVLILQNQDAQILKATRDLVLKE